jgi:hypothetical protein
MSTPEAPTSNHNSDYEAAKNHTENSGEHAEKEKTFAAKSYQMSGFISFLASAFLFVVTFAFFIVYFTKGTYEGHRIALYWGIGSFAFAGIGIFSAYDYYIIKPERDAATIPRVSVAAEVVISGVYRNMQTSYWLAYEYGTHGVASPITDLLYVRLTNCVGCPSLMIDYFSVEISSNGKDWTPATRINVSEGKVFWAAGEQGLAAASEVTLDKPQLTEVVIDKNIGSGDTVKGWVIIERPGGFDGEGDRKWRFKIKDVSGVETIANMAPAVAKSFKETFGGTGFVLGERKDLRQLTAIYYSERSKLP